MSLFPNFLALDNSGPGGRLVVFDIETGPLPASTLEPLVPEFDPGAASRTTASRTTPKGTDA